MKTIMLAAVSAAAFALAATEASAQATQFYDSPALARTYDAATARAAAPNRAAVVRHLAVDAYAAQPVFGYQQPNAVNKHTVYIQDY
jgi:hypothetical protein